MKVEISKIRDWINKNALDQTTYSHNCWDDGDIMFKRSEIKPMGDWNKEDWDELIKEFNPKYIDYKEFVVFLNELEKVKE